MRTAIEKHLATMGRITGRDLGRWVSTHFAENRTRIRAIIDQQMRRSTASGPLPLIAPSGSSSSRSDSNPVPGDFLARREAELNPVVARPSSSSRIFRVLSLGIVALVAAAALVVAYVRQRAKEGPVPAPVAKTATPFGNPSTPLVSVTIRATPSDAVIYVDDVKLPSNPSTSNMVRDGAAHQVRAEAPGFAIKEGIVRFDAPVVSTELVLDPLPPEEQIKNQRGALPRGGRQRPSGLAPESKEPAPSEAKAPTPSAAPPAKAPLDELLKNDDRYSNKPSLDTKDDPWKKK
jgi:serine/threonine-protein kinase